VTGDVLVRAGPGGVVRDAHGRLWLVLDVGRGGATGIDDLQPSRAGLGDRTLVGGRLPDGAAVAEVVTAAGERVVATVGGGAWIALLDEPLAVGDDPPVRFADAAGATVRRELPAAWPREPADDVDAACPACAGRAWEVVTALDGSRGWTSGAPSRLVVCRACGHEECMGAVLQVADHAELPEQLRPEEREEAERLTREHERESRRLVLAELRVPVLAPVGDGPLELRGWGGGAGRGTERLTVRRGDVEVQTADEPERFEGDEAVLREALAQLLVCVAPGEGSAAAFVMGLRTAARSAAGEAARAERGDLALRVDGHGQRFALLRAGDAWVALLRRAGLRVTVSARAVEPADVALEHVDPAALEG
jgi:hypothetical protein